MRAAALAPPATVLASSSTQSPRGRAAESVIIILGPQPPVMVAGPFAPTRLLRICWAGAATLGLLKMRGRRSGAVMHPSLDCVPASAHGQSVASGSVEAPWSLLTLPCRVGGCPPFPLGA